MVNVAPPLLLSDRDRAELELIAASTSLPHRAVRQAQGLLYAADGVANEETARRVRVSANTVRAWRVAFPVRGVGVVAEGRGAKPFLPAGTVSEIVRVTLNEAPPGWGDPLDDPHAGQAGRGREGHRRPGVA